MTANHITVRFPDRLLADAALSRLRLYGAICQSCTVPIGGVGGSTTVHLTVRSQDMPAVRQILRSEGGQLMQ